MARIFRTLIAPILVLSALLWISVARGQSDREDGKASISFHNVESRVVLDSIIWPTIANGTAICSSATQQWGITIGQPIVGEVSSGSMILNLGFWHSLGCCKTRGDVNHEGGPSPIDIADLIYLVDYMFSAGAPPPCWDEGNIDGVGTIDISDLVYFVDYMFLGGPAPEAC